MSPSEFCRKHSACIKGREWAIQHETMTAVWNACKRPDWLLWICKKHAPLTKEQSVRLAVAFAETALQYVPAGEERPRLAVEAAKTWLADQTEENRYAAAYAAYAAACGADDAADAAAYGAAYAAACGADGAYAAYAAADAADAAACGADDAADAAACGADGAADAAACGAYGAAYAAARKQQCEIIRSLIPNPFVDQNGGGK